MQLTGSAVGEVSFLHHAFTGSTPEKVVEVKTALCHGVQVIAADENGANMQVGLADVADNYVTLRPGKAIFVPIDDLNKIYFLGAEGDIFELMLV